MGVQILHQPGTHFEENMKLVQGFSIVTKFV